MKIAVTTFFLIVLLALGGCQRAPENALKKPLVVTSIPPYVSLIQAIVGETMVVESAIGPNLDPHTVEITPRQMQKLQHASLFIGVGEGFEDRLIAAIKEYSQGLTILKLNQETPLLQSEGKEDLHFWLSPQSLALQTEILVQALQKLNPEESELYRVNGEMLLAKIEEINHEIATILAPFSGKSIIVSHAALGYFCHDYHLIQIPVEHEGKSAGPKDADRVLKLAEKSDVICVFTAPQFDNKGAELIAKKLDLRIESFDPMSKDILETLLQIAYAIAES